MKICYLSDALNPHTHRWASLFASFGHEVLLLSDFAPHTQPPELRNVKIVAPEWRTWEKILAFKLYPPPFGNNRWKYLPYRRALGSFKPDLIHGMEALFNGYTTARLLGDGGPPRILMPWGNDIIHDPFQSERARQLVTFALNNVERIVGNFPEMPEHLQKNFGVPPEKVTAFPWGVNLKVFCRQEDDDNEKLRAELGIPPKAQIILSPRNFAPYWGIETIVQSIPHIVKENRNVYFIFMTGSSDRQFLEQQQLWLKWRKCSHHVHIIERRLQAEEVAAMFNLADVFVSAPETDFLAQSVLEGMACGCVPICRNLSVYGTRVRDEVTGFIVPDPFTPEVLAATVVDALGNRLRLSTMSRGAAAQAIELDDERIGFRKMAEVYAKVTGREDVIPKGMNL